jgi:hypothetical protein
MKPDKARDLTEVTVAFEPSLFEGLLLTLDDLEAVHGDEHVTSPFFEVPLSAA